MSEIIKYGDPLKGVEDGIQKGNIKICVAVTSQAKALAPADTGGLRNSIGWRTDTAEGGFNDNGGIAGKILDIQPRKYSGFVGSAQDYAVYQEFGTRRMKPQPYLRPAIAIVVKGQDALNVLKKIQREEMNGALKKGVKRVRF